MTSPHYADLAARLLRARASSADEATRSVSAESRADSVALIQNALREKGARARRRRWTIAGGSFAAAAAIALAIGAFASHSNSHVVRSESYTAPSTAPRADETPVAYAVVAHPSGAGASVVPSVGAPAQTLGEGSQLERGSRVVAGPGGRALLAFSTGTQLTVEENGDLVILQNGSENGPNGSEQRFRLGSGKVHADVAKLHDGHRFVIETSDTEVEVRGTSFDVSVVDPMASCGGGTRTRVSVREGVVVVRHDGAEDRIAAGEDWPRSSGLNCVATTEIDRTPTHAPVHAAVGVALTPSPNQQQTAASALAAQNDLFAQGLAAKRRGDHAEAAAIFDRFVAAYPTSPLIESVTVERMRALRNSDPARAKDAARKYLDMYPSGDARPEAEAFLAQSH